MCPHCSEVTFLSFKIVFQIVKTYQIICPPKVLVGTWKNYVRDMADFGTWFQTGCPPLPYSMTHPSPLHPPKHWWLCFLSMYTPTQPNQINYCPLWGRSFTTPRPHMGELSSPLPPSCDSMWQAVMGVLLMLPSKYFIIPVNLYFYSICTAVKKIISTQATCNNWHIRLKSMPIPAAR